MPSGAQADTRLGRVVGVSDGDTVTALDESKTEHKVRLSGVDAPEKKQAFRNVSKQHLADLVFGGTVTVKTSKRDRYRREVGKVIVGGTDANLEQVRAGLAWHYKKYEREQSPDDRTAYANAETRALIERNGLWHDVEPTPPSEFRRVSH